MRINIKGGMIAINGELAGDVQEPLDEQDPSMEKRLRDEIKKLSGMVARMQKKIDLQGEQLTDLGVKYGYHEMRDEKKTKRVAGLEHKVKRIEVKLVEIEHDRHLAETDLKKRIVLLSDGVKSLRKNTIGV